MENVVFDAIKRRVMEEPYAKKLGLKLVKLDYGYSLVEMVFSEDMENIFGMAHGGAIFSLLDEAFETAANSYGTVSVALSMNVNYIRPPTKGETLFAEAKEIHKSNRVGTYSIEVKDSTGGLIAVCQALVYRKKDPLPFL
jgi:acyl-CoA thioesterase